MTTDWLGRWEAGNTPWHHAEVNPVLVAWGAMFLAGGPHRVLVPLCGKSVDLLWLWEQGHDVVGVDLSDVAIRAFFEESGIVPIRAGNRYVSERLTLVAADICAFETEQPFTRVWDRAATIALSPGERPAYAAALKRLVAPGAVHLIDTISFPGGSGPPFSVPEEEVRETYTQVTVLDDVERDASPHLRDRYDRYRNVLYRAIL